MGACARAHARAFVCVRMFTCVCGCLCLCLRLRSGGSLLKHIAHSAGPGTFAQGRHLRTTCGPLAFLGFSWACEAALGFWGPSWGLVGGPLEEPSFESLGAISWGVEWPFEIVLEPFGAILVALGAILEFFNSSHRPCCIPCPGVVFFTVRKPCAARPLSLAPMGARCPTQLVCLPPCPSLLLFPARLRSATTK